MTHREEESFGVFEQLTSVVGEDDAFEICRMFAGEQIVFPKTILKMKRNYDIRKEFKNGASYRDLGIRYFLTTRQIRIICHPNKKDDDDQMELFDALV